MTEREWYNLKVGDIIDFDILHFHDDKESLKLVIISINDNFINFENNYYLTRSYYDFKVLHSYKDGKINISLRDSKLI